MIIVFLSILMVFGSSACSGEQSSERGSGTSEIEIELAEIKTASFSVNGNCGMCEQRIEDAAMSVEGVASADWDLSAKKIELAFDQQGVDLNEVHEAIALAGHDTEKVRTSDEAYDNLHACCKYERE